MPTPVRGSLLSWLKRAGVFLAVMTLMPPGTIDPFAFQDRFLPVNGEPLSVIGQYWAMGRIGGKLVVARLAMPPDVHRIPGRWKM